MATDIAVDGYICPGERHPISRSVHLARLAAFFPACHECPLREERPGGTAPTVAAEIPPAPRERRELFGVEGVRGIFLNELTRSRADAIAAAFSILLWEDAPPSGRNDGIDRGARQVRPSVVVGYDERASSLSVFAGVVAGLRSMGCQVIDVGLATRPCFLFAIDHVHASGGIFATGSGCEPSWTGMDFALRGGAPLSLGSGLERVRNLADVPPSRPTRTAGTHRTLQASVPYEASLWKHFHDLRPLTVVWATASSLLRRTTDRLFARLPCRLIAVDLPVRARNPAQRRDADILRLSTTVREAKADLGILIDDDGQRCGLIDDRGRHVPAAALAQLFVPPLLAERPASTALLDPATAESARSAIESTGGRCQSCPETFAQIAAAMREGDAVYAGGDSGRHWFNDSYPTCDAVLTFAKTLVALSRSPIPFSEMFAA